MSLLSLENKERLKRLRAKVEEIPQTPGVYLHKNHKNEVLYVGKAKNLRARLKSYFTSLDQHTPKTKALVEKIEDFEVILTQNEYESLLLENNLIKHNMPPYNILLRDDKTYPYLKIDLTEEWPRVVLTRRRKKDRALYFGPYTIPGQIQRIMNIINRYFPLVKCTPTQFKTVSRPCNYYDIKKCLGPCKLTVNSSEYQSHLQNVISILKGNTDEIEKKLKRDIAVCVENLEFEKAALFRDQLKSLGNLSQSQSVLTTEGTSLDMIVSYFDQGRCVFYVTSLRNGKLVGGQAVVLKEILQEPSMLGEENMQEKISMNFICQFYNKHELPDAVIFLEEKDLFSKESVDLLSQYLQNLRNEKNISQNKYFIYLNLEDYLKENKLNRDKKSFKEIEKFCRNNLESKVQELLKLDESSHQVLDDLKQILNLTHFPRWIECYDISTFQGAQTVASQVCMKDGQIYKAGYKKYILKDVTGKSDDFASLREVMRRRFKNQELLPDLLVIDGGTPQVREVAWVLKSLGLDKINLIGLAKSRTQNSFVDRHVHSSQERLVIPHRNSNGELLPAESPVTLSLKEGSPSFRALTKLRDEAHRFAIEFHRKKRDANSMKSMLIDIKGLGPKRRKSLLEACPNLNDLATADLNFLSNKTKIPLSILLEIKEKWIKNNSH